MATHERKLGRVDGIRFAITWLHQQAKEMNDPHARAILNKAAFDLGCVLRDGEPAALAATQDETK
jgi:hypothetical protein